ncbi:RagB/SusD family nutrient uptake outer membrane protein [Siccationidurans ginsengisoli]|uniref:RagB/SusD family nutrient uptake outer membrane protein n=1 Tax=Hymenobacter TaxID=89966 RepID=UPI001AADE4E3|nr:MULTISPECIES: RagB/SusD family nutrient uptake outer membrane protein [unclassified Hymenobacter]MBO2032461.1 RagB/SusD family nutrient uptake outer membrane protein [Hymenobacter sp. BT559]
MFTFNYSRGAFLLTLGLLAGSAGCTSKFLEESPSDQITDANFYKTQNDAIQAVTAAYSELTKEGQYNAALWAMDIGADISTTGGGGGSDGIEYTQIDDYNTPSTNFVCQRLWQGSFIALQRANIVLQKVPLITGMDPAIQKRCLGEAQFIRAKMYFDLVRAFGDVPLYTAPPVGLDQVNIARSPQADVYKVIVSDLTAAIGNLPASYSGADLGRATKWAAQGLLAKVYLTMGDKANAVTQAQAVIDGSGKTMWAKYGDNFVVANENNNAKESLFEVQFTNGRNQYDRNNVGSSMNQFFAPRRGGLVPAGDGYGFNVPEPDFVAGYEPGDTRKAVSVWVPGDVSPNGSIQPKSLPGSPFGFDCKKWFVGMVNTNIWDSPQNVPVLRLAEMYLIVAEGKGATPDGFEALNKVRRRAFGAADYNTPDAVHDLNASNLSMVGVNNFQDAVIRERKYELAFEFDRWFDMKRTKTLISGMTAQSAYLATVGVRRGIPTEKNYVLPIPQSELDANPKLVQNPGY